MASPIIVFIMFQQPTGSILWMAPEVIKMSEDNPYTFQSDVYAFGNYKLKDESLTYIWYLQCVSSQELFCTSWWLVRCHTIMLVTRTRYLLLSHHIYIAIVARSKYLQILFMVGCGFLSPAMEKLRNDTPKALRRLLDNCLNYTRDDRPAFRNVSWKCTRF